MAFACSICADNLFNARKDISAVPCGHTFHRDCLDQWWVNHKSCPNCRQMCHTKTDKLYFEDLEDEEFETLSAKITQLQDILAKTERDSVRKTKELQDTLEKTIHESQCTIKELQDTSKRNNEENRRTASRLNKQINKLLKRPTYKDVELLRGNIKTLEAEIHVSSTKYEDLRFQATEKDKRLLITSHLLTRLRTESDQKLNATIEENRRLKNENRCKSEENARQRGEISLKTQSLETARNSLMLIETANHQKLEAERNKKRNMEHLISSLENSNAELQMDLSDCRENIFSLKGHIRTYTKEIDDLNIQSFEYRKLLFEERNALDRLRSSSDQKIKTALEEKTLLQMDLNESTQQIKLLENRICNYKKDIYDLHNKKQVLELSARKLRCEKDSLRVMLIITSLVLVGLVAYLIAI